MPPLSIWVASSGAAGMERQGLSIALAVRDRLASVRAVDVKVSRLAQMGWRGALPLWAQGDLRSCLAPDEAAMLRAGPFPDLWIGTGRASLGLSIGLRRWSGGKTLVVQTQDPRAPRNLFDLIVPPLHDGLAGENVLPIIGAPVYFAPDAIAQAKTAAAAIMARPGQKLLVAIGGGYRRRAFAPALFDAWVDDLQRLATAGAQLLITTSRRTPPFIAAKLEALRAMPGNMVWRGPPDGPNPYLAFLVSADAALVTPDSVNMSMDAAFFGLPIHWWTPPNAPAKFAAFYADLIARDQALWFGGEIDFRRRPAFQEIERVVDRVLAELRRRGAIA